MPSFGQFEIVRDLYRSGLYCVASARKTGGPEAFVVKECRASPSMLGEARAAALVAAFLRRAEVQKKAAAAGAHWAPIHDSGPSAEGGSYATDLYPRSAQKLIVGRVKLDAKSLGMIVESVLAGLRELRDSCGRAHGNIKATNVLIDGSGEDPLAKVVLTDPADAGAEGVSAGADLRALGELIHLLVLHQPLRAQTGWPLAPAPEWGRLGPSGEAWRELCNRLLDPALVSEPPPLEEIRIPAPGQGRRARGLLWAGLAAGVLLLGGGGAAYLVLKKPAEPPVQALTDEAWVALCGEYDTWFAGLVSPDPARARLVRDTFSGDPHLGEVLKALGSDTSTHNLRNVTGSGLDARDQARMPAPGSGDGKRKVAAAAAAVARIKEVFSEEQLPRWQAWNRARTLMESCRKRGWTGPANYLGRITSRVAAGPDLLAAVGDLRKAQADGELDSIARLEESAEALAATGDKVLATFADVAAAALAMDAEAVKDPGAAQKLRQAIADLDQQAARIRAFLASADWRRVDRHLFETEGPVYRELAASGPRPEHLRAWLHSAQNDKNFWLPEGDDPRVAPVWGSLEPVEQGIAALRDTYRKDPAEFQGALDKARREISSLADLRWTAANQNEINARSGDLRKAVADLTQDVKRRVAQEEGVANMDYAQIRDQLAGRDVVVAEDSREINQAWRQQRDALLAAAEQIPEVTARKEALVGPSKNVEDFLVEIDKAFASATDLGAARTRDWGGGLSTAVNSERERAIGGLLSGMDWRGVATGNPPPIDPSSAERFRVWSGRIAEIGADIAAVEDAIDAFYALGEPGPSGRPITEILAALQSDAVFTDPGVQSAVAPVLDRVRQLEQIGSQTQWPALLAAATSGRPAQQMAAWRRLRAPEVQPPSVRQSLEDESRIRKDLAAGPVGALRDEARKSELLAELSARGEEWWAHQFGRAATPEDIELAIAARDGAYQGRDDALDPRLRYNLRLFELTTAHSAAKAEAKPDQEKLKAAVEGFIASAAPLRVSSSEPAAAFLAALRAMTSMEGPPPVDVRTLGPGSLPPARIAAAVEEDEDTVRFTLNLARPADARQRTPTLTFRRVTPADGPEAFVCTQEVSVALFSSIVSEAGAWADLGRQGRLIYDDEAQPQNDTRFGPRTWEPARGGAATGNPIRLASRWLFGTPAVAGDRTGNSALLSPYPPTLDAGRPAWGSPMTWVSPAAALFMARQIGCRLSTAAEWEAAMASERSGLDLGGYISAKQPNLRDQTWADHKQYIDGLQISPQNRGPVAPIGGSFWAQSADTAAAQAYSDRTLWFWETERPSDGRFSNLVGNVAEMILTDVEEADALPVAAPLAACETATGQQWSRIAVIGGSAQSPGEARVDAAIPFKPSLDGPYYSDVGFRLAFTAANTGGPTILSMLSKELEGPRYLLP